MASIVDYSGGLKRIEFSLTPTGKRLILRLGRVNAKTAQSWLSKAVKDHAETFDGVPSQHDGKDAVVIGELCWMGKSSPWPWQQRTEEDQALRFWVRKLDTALMSQAGVLREAGGAAGPALAGGWGTAQAVGTDADTGDCALGRAAVPAKDPTAAAVLQGFGGHYLSEQKIQRVIASASSTLGVRMSPWQVRELQATAEAIGLQRQQIAECKQELKKLARKHPVIQAKAPAIGLVSACALAMCLGDVRNYASAAAYRKAMGLNLKERSSGMYKGKLSLSKRGLSVRARKWLDSWPCAGCGTRRSGAGPRRRSSAMGARVPRRWWG